MKRETIAEIQARRAAGNRARKISGFLFSAAGPIASTAMLLTGSSFFESLMAGLACMAVAELLDINIALRGGE